MKILYIAHGDFCIAGCGAFQLVDNVRSNVANHFKIGEEIATFENIEDFKKKVEYYLGHTKERISIGEASYKRIISEHTYENRLKKILS